MPDITIVIIIVGALALLGLAVWGFLRWRYVQGLKEYGWQFDSSPDIGHVVGLNRPPFGTGFRRRVDDMVRGRSASGWEFKAIEYDHDGWRSDHYVVIFPLPRSLPSLYVSDSSRPSRVPGRPGFGTTLTHGRYSLIGDGDAYVREIGGIVAASMPALADREVSIDHAHIVVLDVPTSAADLHAVVEAGAELARAVADASANFSAPDAPPYLSFSHRPGWTYIPRDDSWLSRVPHTGGGHGHEAWDIVHGEEYGIGFIRLEHRWKTTHRDKDGRTSTRHHKEFLCPFYLAFPFGALDLGTNPLGIGNDRWGLQFESAQFNEAYKVSAAEPKFAHDVLHPRMMEWLLAQGAPRVHISANGRIRIPDGGRWGVAELESANSFLWHFFARVPDFVWRNLGAWPRPVPEIELRTP